MNKFPVVILVLLLFASCERKTERLTEFAVHGLDVSHYQSRINWEVVASQEIDFTFVKATEGEEMKDSLFATNWAALKRVGILRGAYHFFHPRLSAFRQARNFIKTVDLQPGDLPPVLDVETTNGSSSAIILNRMRSWLQIVEAHYGVRPVIYTNLRFYEKYLAREFADYPVWIARYNYQPPRLSDRQHWHFWQYGDTGRINGIDGDVDFNVFYGSREELSVLCVPVRTDDNDLVKVDFEY